MIFDKIENLRLYEKLNPRFAKAMDYLEKTDFNSLAHGKHLVDGENVFALYQAYKTKDADECKIEAHQQYIDIQYVIEGKEIMGVTSLASQLIQVPYDAERDVAFFFGDTSPVKVDAGHFTIFFPDDLHQPSVKVVETMEVRKVVMKIRVN